MINNEENKDWDLVGLLFKNGRAINVPKEPITLKRIFEKVKEIWPMNFKQSKILEIEHSQNEKENIWFVWGLIFKNLPWKTDKNGFPKDICEDNFAVLFNPKTMKVCCQEGKGKNWSPISHPIMNLFSIHGKHLCDESKSDDIPHSGEKRKRDEEGHIFNENDQYFGKNLWLFWYREPWFMWAMACEHSRIARVYYVKENTQTGGLGSCNCEKKIA